MKDSDLISVARLVRPYLPDLVDDAEAVKLDQQIGEALKNLRDPALRQRLRGLLAEHDSVLRWAQDVLEDPRLLPPEFRDPEVRGVDDYQSLPGKGDPIPADRYICPVDQDVIWYRPKVGVPIPICGTHGQQLVRG